MAGAAASTSTVHEEEEFVCLYLDDVCEEVELEDADDEVLVLADEEQSGDTSDTGRESKRRRSQAAKKTSKRKRTMLSKDEKARVMLSIRDVDIDSLLKHVREIVSTERHILDNSVRRNFWTDLQKSEEMTSELLKSLVSLFASLYKGCDKGKEKYLRFQLEWHRCCSVFLLTPDKSLSGALGANLPKGVNLSLIQQRWMGYCEGKSVEKPVRDAVMISICSAVYNYLLKRVSAVQKSLLELATSTDPVLYEDADSVYYRFCGAALANMLHARYSKQQTCKKEHKQSIEQEILVLKCMQCADKSHIPEELKYRDRGCMYFPSEEFLSFLRGLDRCIMENANESSFKKYGPELVEVAVKQVEATQEFQQQFKSLITSRLLERSANVNVSDFDTTIKLVYKELSQKLCHTRLGEFISATEQKVAAAKGKSTLAGQNLRDELLTSHVKTKSLLH